MHVEISERWSWFHQWVNGPIVLGVPLVLVVSSRGLWPLAVMFAAVWGIGVAAWSWPAFVARRVIATPEGLRVGRAGREVLVPYGAIGDVDTWRANKFTAVIVRVEPPAKPPRVVFIAPAWRSDDVVALLHQWRKYGMAPVPRNDPRLHRYWLEFDAPVSALPAGAGLGCGVTAWTEADALVLISATLFDGGPLPPVRRLVEDVDVSTLDRGHVLPNMRAPVGRGVWFPLT